MADLQEQLILGPLAVRKSPLSGYGVFATDKISANSVIEQAHIIIIPSEHRLEEIRNYTFKWEQNKIAIALGFASIYNHSDEPNANYTVDKANKLIKITTLRDIDADEEILINYGKQWFTSRMNNNQQHKSKELNPIFPLVGYGLLFCVAFYILFFI